MVKSEGEAQAVTEEEGCPTLSEQHLQPVPGFILQVKRQAAQVSGPQAVRIHYFTETCCRQAGPETSPLSVVKMLGIICKV